MSVKVPERMKKEMQLVEGKVEWPVEIRNFIESRLDQVRREEAVERAERVLKNHPGVKAGTASKLVREDRDSGH